MILENFVVEEKPQVRFGRNREGAKGKEPLRFRTFPQLIQHNEALI